MSQFESRMAVAVARSPEDDASRRRASSAIMQLEIAGVLSWEDTITRAAADHMACDTREATPLYGRKRLASLLLLLVVCAGGSSAGSVPARASDCTTAFSSLTLRAPAFGLDTLRLRGGGRDIKIEHRAFVANLPRTLTDKGLREAFEEFGKIKEARVSAPNAIIFKTMIAQKRERCGKNDFFL